MSCVPFASANTCPPRGSNKNNFASLNECETTCRNYLAQSKLSLSRSTWFISCFDRWWSFVPSESLEWLERMFGELWSECFSTSYSHITQSSNRGWSISMSLSLSDRDWTMSICSLPYVIVSRNGDALTDDLFACSTGGLCRESMECLVGMYRLWSRCDANTYSYTSASRSFRWKTMWTVERKQILPKQCSLLILANRLDLVLC